MKRTIFAKLMSLSMSVILVSSIVLGAVHFFLIEKYMVNSRTDMLVKNAERISSLTELFAKNYSIITQSIYEENINTISTSSETYTILTDLHGKVMFYSKNIRSMISMSGTLNVADFAQVESGKSVVKRGVFNDLFETPVITAAVPLKSGGNIYGMVLVNYPYPSISKDTYALISLLLISLIAGLIIACIMSYIMSLKISNPIKQLANVTAGISKGDFQKRGVESDIIEINELTSAFNTMAEELEKNDDAHATFIANVSHDLRTPITTIGGFVGGILDGTIPPERQKEYLRIVLDESRRMSELVSVFLDISRYQMGEIQLYPETFDINDEIRATLVNMENRIKEKDVSVNVTFDRQQCFIYADKAAIRRVLTNLADNAVKFVNEQGEINITVKEAGKKAEISIENTGSIISPKDKKHIWERFYKSDKSRTQDKKGFGLGLFIVKNIINQHGQNITLQSGDNKTKFIFFLPLSGYKDKSSSLPYNES